MEGERLINADVSAPSETLSAKGLMMKPTQDQINDEIKRPEELKPKVRQYTAFGDDNRAAIEMQIAILKGETELDELDDQQSAGDITDHEYDNGTEACNWLDGESESTTLSEGWAELAR